jgi:hypothetical protein
MTATVTELERTVREEQEEFDASDSSTSDEEAKPEEALFDKAIYEREELQLPKVDGEATDKIAVKFSGTVLLDRSDPADVALMRKMKLGGDITLNVEAKCAGKGHKFTTSREGELDAIVLEHGVRVHTVSRPAAA